jgi:chlorophyll synthase
MNRPDLATVAELLKPITWFPPMWAFACGMVSTGQSLSDNWRWHLAGRALGLRYQPGGERLV